MVENQKRNLKEASKKLVFGDRIVLGVHQNEAVMKEVTYKKRLRKSNL